MSSKCSYFRHFSFIEEQFSIITLALNEGLETYHHLCYHQEKIKYLDITVTKYLQALYEENYTTLIDEFKEDKPERESMLINRKTQHCQNVSSFQLDL